ncbi:DUF998 domain-containing protein [Sphaerisporangium fuscum]|uniref:DUF998 domain-containing protein n=1 Tax=Sphaerisporangium fuscum TaxID=2835868 RepID=UPI001BDBD16F|nr:DUF998 domain-containing protein [Sphaerisporangium fuscum]
MRHLRTLYPLAAGSGLLIASIMLVSGPASASRDVLDLTIGQATALDQGGAGVFAMALLGLSCVALLAGMRAVGAPLSGWPERLTAAGAGALACAAVFPGTPFSDIVLVAGLMSLAGAVALMVRRFAGDERWRAVARPFEWLALGAGGGLAVLTYVALPGHRVMIGLVEWALLAIEIAALALATAHLTRLAWSLPPVEVLRHAGTYVQAQALEMITGGRRAATAMTVTTENAASGGRTATALLTRH